MKVFLTHGYFLEEDEKEKLIMKPYPPLGLLYISAWLEKHDVACTVFDSTFSSFASLCSRLETEKPMLIGIYVNLMTKLNVLRLIKFIRTSDALKNSCLVLGGPEVRNHIANFLEKGADVIVLGEGEESMLEVTRAVDAHPGDWNMHLEKIPGIAFRSRTNDIIENSPRPLLRSMDELPYPDRKKIDLDLYFRAWKEKHGQSAVSVSTMRGCPYTCRWCSRAVYGQTYRRRSAALVADELQWLRDNYDFDTVWFVDDVFTISHKWLQQFHDELASRKLSIRYECITRADRLDEETMRLLRDSGCFRVWIGAESGSQRVLDAMDRRVDAQQVREMIRLARRYSMQAGTFIMLGYPGETEEDIEETIRHLVESAPDLYTITVAYPIKGTPLYSEVEASLTRLPWDSSTDRDLDFRRTYPRRYYDFALRRLHNEVAFHKAGNRGIGKYRFRLKSAAAKTGMVLLRMLAR